MFCSQPFSSISTVRFCSQPFNFVANRSGYVPNYRYSIPFPTLRFCSQPYNFVPDHSDFVPNCLIPFPTARILFPTVQFRSRPLRFCSQPFISSQIAQILSPTVHFLPIAQILSPTNPRTENLKSAIFDYFGLRAARRVEAEPNSMISAQKSFQIRFFRAPSAQSSKESPKSWFQPKSQTPPQRTSVLRTKITGNLRFGSPMK